MKLIKIKALSSRLIGRNLTHLSHVVRNIYGNECSCFVLRISFSNTHEFFVINTVDYVMVSLEKP